jgi:hypothetical protein
MLLTSGPRFLLSHEARGGSDIAAYASRVVVMKDGLILSDTLRTAQMAFVDGTAQAAAREAS